MSLIQDLITRIVRIENRFNETEAQTEIDAGGGASDVDDLTTDTGSSGEMVRVASGGGLEYRTPAEVRSDIGAEAVGGSGWTDDGSIVRLTTSTDNVSIGSALNGAKLDIIGDADEVQFKAKGNATQTEDIVVISTNAGDDLFVIGADGLVDLSDTAVSNAPLVKLTTQSMSESSVTYNPGFFLNASGEPVFVMIRSNASYTCFSAGVESDTVRRFLLAVDGTMSWGDGSSARDTALSRTAAGVMRLVADFNVIGDQTVDGTQVIGGDTVNGNLNVMSQNVTGCIVTLSRDDTGVFVGNTIGKIQFWNNDSNLTTQNIFADIEVIATQSITTDAAAGYMVFRTTGTTAGSSPVERLRIDEDGIKPSGLVAPSFSDATRPAAGLAGSIIFNTDDGMLNIDDGTNWTLPDGTTT